ncbi:MAG TPA: VTT domain-containing protein [Bryobacteraceae bacterium]|nr:VTT domain-containing protein [Bryobacteraceae bacterium]
MLASWGPLGVFGFAAAESAGIPNPGGTDLLLVAMTAARPSQSWLCALMAVMGSLAGTAVFFEMMRRGGEALLSRRASGRRGQKLSGWFKQYGIGTVFITGLLPVPGLPFKVFAACAGALGESRTRFLLVLLAARIPRYFALAFLGASLGDKSWPWIKSHTWQMAAAAAFLAAGLYLLLRCLEARAQRCIAPGGCVEEAPARVAE